MKKMQNGNKLLQMDKQSMVIVLMDTKVQFQENVFNLVQLGIGVLLLVLVMVLLIFFYFILLLLLLVRKK